MTSLNMASSQEHAECMLISNFRIVNLQEQFLSFFKVTCSRLRLSIIVIEDIIIDEVTSNWIQIDEDLFELTIKEKSRCHALPTGDRITLGSWTADQVKVLLRCFDVLFLEKRKCILGLQISVSYRSQLLSKSSVNYTFQNILMRNSRLDFFH